MAHIPACPRIPVAKLGSLVPVKYIEALEQNQKLTHCCRHPENHELEAFYSCDAEAMNGTPDVYIFHCICGRRHIRFCCGKDDIRPTWEVK